MLLVWARRHPVSPGTDRATSTEAGEEAGIAILLGVPLDTPAKVRPEYLHRLDHPVVAAGGHQEGLPSTASMAWW